MPDLTFLDGGFGTMVQAAGLPPGKDPADWNIENPDAVAAVHRAYAAAGANIVLANTFGANRLKYHGQHALSDLISAAISCARADAGENLGLRHATCDVPEPRSPINPSRVSWLKNLASPAVALDIGPTGRLLKPAGDLDFAEAYDAFAEMVRIGAAAGADLVFVETMGDTRELKAAVLAAKQNCDLPVMATVALDEGGKLLTGASVECVATLLESLGVDAYGFNCGLGPDKMLPFVERLAKVATKPVIVKPNAGMPKIVDGKTVFTVGPEEFGATVAKLVEAGATIVGGCCGTTPAHIEACAAAVRGGMSCSAAHVPRRATRISSGSGVVELKPHAGLVIGERINPTGKKLLKEAYLRGDSAYVLREAVKQTDAGAEVLDVNCGVPGIDEAATLEQTVETVQSVVTCPIQIDTADPAALERALKCVNGKPLVNSVNGKRESMDAVFPLVKRYGGAIVGLCLDESGIPSTSGGRLAIAKRILDEGAKYGFAKEDFVFDALTLAVSADPQAAVVTLETVKRLTEELGVNTVLGVSNVSFGLPNRPALNNAMYALAKRCGLSAAIANPSLIRDELDPAAEDVLLARDRNCERWIALNAQVQAASSVSSAAAASSGPEALGAAIRRGLRDDASNAAKAMLDSGATPMDVIERGIVPALEQVGNAFEKGTAFLPQLLMAADAAGDAFAVVRKSLKDSQSNNPVDSHGRPIVIATVKGDIHDIGKNIVRALLENYGFDVVDLGRDVPPETIVERARACNAGMIGLSALMTTTVGAMSETIRLAKAAGLDAKTFVGGAVVTQEYADSIGADFYAKDAMQAVRIAERVLGG